MTDKYIVTGTLTDDRTVRLDDPLPIAPGRVQVTVENLGRSEPGALSQIVSEIRERQKKRGYRPPSQAEVDAYLREERDNWNR